MQPKKSDRSTMYLRLLAWLGLAAIVTLTMVPPHWPITPLPHALEHGLAFMITAAAFGACYRNYGWQLTLAAPLFCGAIELPQLLVVGRHARLSDFYIDTGLSLVGLCIGFATRGKNTNSSVAALALGAIALAAGSIIPLSAVGQIKHSDAPESGVNQSRAIKEAIFQNTRRNNRVHPAGVPANWSWYGGKSGRATAAPAPKGFSAINGWGVIYPEAGFSSDLSGGEVTVAGFSTFVHLIGGSWVEVQNQAHDPVNGGHFAANFSGNASSPLAIAMLSDGSTKIDVPATGYNDHFWLATRGSFKPGTIDGIFVTAKFKASQTNAHLVAALGADWWRNSSADFRAGFANNPEVGQSNFVQLMPQWQTLYFYSVTAQQLQSDPPPLAALAAGEPEDAGR